MNQNLFGHEKIQNEVIEKQIVEEIDKIVRIAGLLQIFMKKILNKKKYLLQYYESSVPQQNCFDNSAESFAY